MKFLKTSAVYFFCAYFVVQWAGFAFAPKREYFPVFSWSLFSQVRNDVHDVVVEVSKVGDREYAPALNFFELGEVFPAAAKRDTGVLKAARKLAATHPEAAGYAARENAFIASFFDIEHDVEFQLTVVRFDPLERWHTGQIIARHPISTHSTGDEK